MTGKQHVAVWVGAIVVALAFILIVTAERHQPPAGRPDHYPNPIVSVTR